MRIHTRTLYPVEIKLSVFIVTLKFSQKSMLFSV